jgi:cardiolipin synthase
MAAPKLTAAAREAESAPRAVAENPPAGAVAREVRAVGGHGRPLGAGEREALVRRLGREGDAALLNRQLAAMAQTDDVELHDGNRARLLVDGPATFEAMFGAIAGAQRRVLIESYIVDDAAIARRLADLLVDRRRHGVQVALLYDDIGSFGTDAGYFERLQAAGV